MKLIDLNILNEMPDYSSKKLARGTGAEHVANFHSEETLEREYTLLKEYGDNVAAYIANVGTDKVAIIGTRRMRPPKNVTNGIKIHVTLDLKNKEIMTPGLAGLKNMLQVDYVSAHDELASRGMASLLYQAIVTGGGYMLACDEMQYFHGRKLWETLVKESGVDYVINVVKNGKLVADDSGQPLAYDGQNIPADQIWGPDGKMGSENQFTILVMRRK